MLDRKFILENPDLVRESCRNRGVEADIDQLVALETKRRELDRHEQDLNREANEKAKMIGKASTAKANQMGAPMVIRPPPHDAVSE